MGYQTAVGINDTDLSLPQKVSWHFQSNCYPPVPLLMVPVACTAIVNVLNEEGDKDIELPNGVSFKGDTSVNGYTIVENLHLWAFVYENLEGEDE